jgi:hypothetical protein
MKNLASRLAWLAIVVTVLPSPAMASPSEKPVFVWLAASSSRPIVSNQLGRLSIKDDVLSFDGSEHDWRVTLDDVRQVTVSPGIRQTADDRNGARREVLRRDHGIRTCWSKRRAGPLL